ncbi:MAG: MFS transporter [Acidobacteriota bacterium]|nr:MFS transporter [Acidobacteriota bacterium]MDQ2843614.1 MFS transporter [Acidobacteriota bacterium]
MFQLSPSERATLLATFAGWMLDGMDVMVYSFVIPSLIALWHLTTGQAGLLGTSALVISSIGGWLAGYAADRYGRVKILQLTILWFAFFTFLSGFTNSFPQLLVIRGLQGLGFGGEWAVGSVLMGETICAKHRGRAVGTVQAGWAIGWGIAALCFVVFFSLMPPALAWRMMFWVGILPALLIFYIRGHVAEPDVFVKAKQVGIAGKQTRFHQIFSPSLIRVTALASLLSLGAQGGYYAIMTWLPLFLKTYRRLSVFDTGRHLAVIIFGAFIGYLVSADLTDRIGRRGTLILFAGCSFLTVWSYTGLTVSSPGIILLLGFPLGFFSSGSFSPMGSFLTELFPTLLRASGQGFAYNFGRGVGALFPTFVGYLAVRLPLARAIAIFALSAYALMAMGAFLLPETRRLNNSEECWRWGSNPHAQ